MDDEGDQSEARMFKLERVIFYAAFVVRKLIENGKITDKVARHVVEVAAFKANDAYRLSLSGSFTRYSMRTNTLSISLKN